MKQLPESLEDWFMSEEALPIWRDALAEYYHNLYRAIKQRRHENEANQNDPSPVPQQ
jgi:hypothetical protein